MKKRISDAASRFLSVKTNEYRIKHQLENAIPNGKKYKILRRMARLFDKSPSVENYRLFQTFNKKVRNDRRQLKKPSQKDYNYKKDYYDIQIRNRFKKLNELWKPLGRKVRFRQKKSHIILARKSQKQP